jgi:hypothetical protein
MHRKIAITIMALSLGGCLILTSPPASAQSDQQPLKMAQTKSGDDKKTVTPSATRKVTPSASRTTVTPRTTRTTVTPRTTRTTVTKRATRTTVTPRTTRTTVTKRATRKLTPSATRTTVTKRATRKLTPSATRTTVTPLTTRKLTRPAARTVTLSGATARTVTAGRLRGVPLRGAGRAKIRGHNFSVWRSGHRVRHGSGWRTFIALSALSAILIGSNNYYPYAYLSAPQSYCEGLTEDGCQLMWQEVETLEGDVVYQCVAYCPWQ